MTGFELLAPLLLMVVFGALDVGLRNRVPSVDPRPFTELKRGYRLPCRVFESDLVSSDASVISGAWCAPIAFAPTTAASVVQVMDTLATRAGLPRPVTLASNLGQTSSGSSVGAEQQGGPPHTVSLERSFVAGESVLGFGTVAELKTWLAANPGRAGVAIVFGDTREIVQADGSVGPAQVRAPA